MALETSLDTVLHGGIVTLLEVRCEVQDAAAARMGGESESSSVTQNAHDQDDDAGRTELLVQLRHADCLVTLGQVSLRVAHDVGTPLAVIAGRSSMIANGQLSGEDAKRSAVIIAEQAERIREVLQRMIELTRWQSTAYENKSMGELIARGLVLVAPLARAKAVEVVVTQEDAALVPRADGQHVLQIVTNVVAHSLATAVRGSRVELCVERFEAWRGLDPRVPPGGHVQVKLWHQPEREEEIKALNAFDLFHVVQAQYVPSYFGLAISDAIVRSHGGRLFVERGEDGRHCTSFHIPLAS